MIITIQAVKERENYIREQIKDFVGEPIIHIDEKRQGCLTSFMDMLEYKDDYRAHLQDDIILADNFEKYLPYLTDFMSKNDIHLFSLYVPKMRRISQLTEYRDGISYLKWFVAGFFPLQGAIFSSKFIDLMRKEIKGKKREYYENMQKGNRNLNDDEFIMLVANKYKINSYLHIPSLVQHNVNLASVNGNNVTMDRISDNFEKNYITKKLKI